MEVRNLTTGEIEKLERQGCRAESWNSVLVADPFLPERFYQTTFSGKVTIARQDGFLTSDTGKPLPCGISRAAVCDCIIGENNRIDDIGFLSGYETGKQVMICHVGSMETTGETSFGNGVHAEVLNESGGREVILFDRLSAQIAYMMALYREDFSFTDRLKKIIEAYCEGKKSSLGYIGDESRIIGCEQIKNVRVGEMATLQGVTLLEDGTIVSKREAPVFAGPGVSARHFIIQSGSSVDGGALLLNCFVGQGVQIGKQFSAENSLFFANCEGFHSEACSIFAGPYTVTHHKSTLLIASLYSFFNAGSGTNHSNHMYKLGPVHQGIFDRGSKTGSFAYVLLPSRIGPYSVIIGKHFSNFDASEFPFSYIREEEGKSVLYPGMNLFTVGTKRDAEKWPVRDRRKDADKLDLIHFDLFNPYVAGRCRQALDLMQSLAEKTSRKQEHVQYKGLRINRLMLSATMKYYTMALHIFYGDHLIKRLEKAKEKETSEAPFAQLVPKTGKVSDVWHDLCGLIAPANETERLRDDIQKGKINELKQLEKRLHQLYAEYDELSWSWTAVQLEKTEGLNVRNPEREKLERILTQWKDSKLQLNQLILADAKKEFEANSRIGYGIDGDTQAQEMDFINVRGTFENNKFVKGILEENEKISDKYKQMIELIHTLS